MGTSGPAKLIEFLDVSTHQFFGGAIGDWWAGKPMGNLSQIQKASYLVRLSCRPHRQAQGLLGGVAIRQHDVGPAEIRTSG